MIQEMEVTKTKPGVTAQELRDVLKYGEELIGPDYLQRMKEIGLLGDVSFVAELNGGVYLISYYLFGSERKKASAPLKSIPSVQKYMEKIEPLFAGAETIKLSPANSFWTFTDFANLAVDSKP